MENQEIYFHTENNQNQQNNSSPNGVNYSAPINNQPIYYIPPVKERKSIKFDKKDTIFTAIFAALSFLMIDFTLLHGLNLGFTISFFALFTVVSAYLFKKENKTSAFSYICGFLSLAGSVTFTVYHDYFINAVMFFIIAGLFTVYTCGLSGTFSNKQGSYKICFDMLSGIFVKPFSNSPEIRNGFKDANKKNGGIKNVFIGIAVSFPVLLVVIPLLISSDEAFGSLMSIVLKSIGKYLVELVISVFVFLYVVFYFIAKRKRLGISTDTRKPYKGFVPKTVSITFLSVISLVYLTYLFSQLAYFFSAFSGILPEGYELTASEFARRGFFEMFAICAINMIIITLVCIFTKRTGKTPVAIKAISSFIMLFSVLLLITSMAKMKLNIEIFGLSKNRIMVCTFMLMMLVAILFYILHIINPKISYMQSIVVICSAIFIALAFSNIDARIAEYNINAYESSKIDTLDVKYLANLSDSSVPYVVELIKSDDKDISLKAQYEIYEKLRFEYYDYDNSDFREYNCSAHTAVSLCKEYYDGLSPDEKKYFDEKLSDDYYEKYYEDEYSNEYYNEYSDSYSDEV
ncbi:MAG: DUF4173 domain-containing protein [Eubacterium sp.]|nr:DUF4173 domain-containing protein [Eubacterium sp.]